MDDIDHEQEHLARLKRFKAALKRIENEWYVGKDGKRNMVKNYIIFDDKELNFTKECPKEVRSIIRPMFNKYFLPPFRD